MNEFDEVVWEGSEEDAGDTLRLLYSSQLDIVALQHVGHNAAFVIEPQTMAALCGAFLAWSHGTSLN